MKSIKSLEVFNHQRLVLGEGPISFGINNENVAWVDILGRKVVQQNLVSHESSTLEIDSHVSFVIPQDNGGFLLGTNPSITRDGNPGFTLSRTARDLEPTRWNDAKVGPGGELWLGTITYAESLGAAALYRWQPSENFPEKIFDGTTVSNGMAWSRDNKKMYFIDSPSRTLHVFPYSEGQITGEPEKVQLPEEYGYPDGMCIDSEDGLWIAFWMGSAVRRFDARNNFKVTHIIQTPVERTTSCVFAGADLQYLIITTAHMNLPKAPEMDGKTFIFETNIAGSPTSCI